MHTDWVVVIMTAALAAGWGRLSIALYKLTFTWKAYGAALMMLSYMILVYRDITGFSTSLTYGARLFQISALICFWQVLNILGKKR